MTSMANNDTMANNNGMTDNDVISSPVRAAANTSASMNGKYAGMYPVQHNYVYLYPGGQ